MNSSRVVVLFALSLAACGSPPTATPASPASPATSASSASTSTPERSPADAGSSATPAPSASTAASEPATPPGTPRERLMRAHFKEASLIRTAVIDGKLGDAIAPAQSLAKNEGLGKMDPSWQSSVDVLEYAAKRIQHGSDIPAVAAAIADIGIACGACHKAAGGPKAKVDAPPAVDASTASRMHRHVWATERLWDGIIVPSDASWSAGAAALAGEPFPKEILDKGGVHGRSAAARFKTLVAAAPSKKKPDERGQLYASLLETCSACHVVTRDAK